MFFSWRNSVIHLIKSRRLEVQASQKNTEVVKYSRAPTIDASYQANISTANNLTGQFYPYGILPMTGPPSASNIYTAATGSAASLLLNWQAVTFGMRDAQIQFLHRTDRHSIRQSETGYF